jgi:hypothetical protein
MKVQILWMTLILVAIFASATVSTRAQAVYGVRANVPFDFIVGDETIPAGNISAYGVSSALAGPLAISNLDHGDFAKRAGRSVLGTSESNQCKLVFRQYGNRYYLAQIWMPGHKAWEVMKSKEEKSLEREMRLAKNFKPTVVVAAATKY